MILTSTTETVPFTPPWLCEEDGSPKTGAPVFHLRAGSVIERGQMEAELAGTYRAAQVNGFELVEAIRKGVETLLADDPGLDEAMALVEAEAQGEADGLSEQERQSLAGIREVLAEHWQPYRDLIAQAERRRNLAPLVALRRFCTGIDAPGVTFAKGRDGLVSDATLSTIDPFVLTVAGGRAFNLQFAGSNAPGFLPQPEPSDSNPKPSPSDDTSTVDGPSKKRRGRKTPA